MSLMDFLTFDINRILPNTQRRMKITLLVLAINVTLFTLGLFRGANLVELGGGLAAVESPIIAWIFAESIRPTGEYKIVKTTTTTTDPETGTVQETIKNE